MSEDTDYYYDEDDHLCHGDIFDMKRLNIDNSKRRYLCLRCGAILPRQRLHYEGKNKQEVKINLAYPFYADIVRDMYPNAEIIVATEDQIKADKERRRAETKPRE